MIDSRGLNTSIEVDGRISLQNIEDYGASMVDIFVAGSTCISGGGFAASARIPGSRHSSRHDSSTRIVTTPRASNGPILAILQSKSLPLFCAPGRAHRRW